MSGFFATPFILITLHSYLDDLSMLVSLSLSPQLKPQLWLRKPLLSTHPSPPPPPTNQK